MTLEFSMPKLLQISEPSSSKIQAIGIDLGTTNSVVAYMEEGEAHIVKDDQGRKLIPSLVSEERVGHQAYEYHMQHDSFLVKSVKRSMGQASTKILNDLTPIDLSSKILHFLKALAEKEIGHPIDKAVITVPAYFNETERMATKEAANLAGLEVLRLIHEPTAAALAYGLDKGVEGLYGVYDLGGGTFDFSLLRLEKGVFKVLATGGDTALGGDDFDQALLSLLQTKYPFISSLQEKDPFKVLFEARRIKESLSQNEDYKGPFLGEKIVHITRQEYENTITPYIEKTFKSIKRVLRDAKVDPIDIQGIVLVGGATRTPLVISQIEKFFHKAPLKDINPDEVVAQGAALQAYALTHQDENSPLLLDVTPLSLGIETLGGLVERIIPRNSPIPLSKSQDFTTSEEGQTAIRIHVIQGEKERIQDCISLGHFELQDIPSMPAGFPRIRVTFSLDADGLLLVKAQELSSGISQSLQVQPMQTTSLEKAVEHLKDI